MSAQPANDEDYIYRPEPTVHETRRWRRQGLWRNLLFWRVATTLALIVAALAIAANWLSPPPSAVINGATFAASLGPPELIEPYIVTVDAEQGVLRAPGQPAPDPTRSAQLWLVFAGERPHAVALLNPSRPLKVVLPPEVLRRVVEGVGVVVTLEPLGGSTTGTPTGLVVAKGTITVL